MKTIRLLQSLLIALVVFSGVAFAHGECPGTGVIDYSSMTCFFPDGSSPPMTIGVPSSGSSGGSRGSSAPSKPRVLDSKYGAIALNMKGAGFDSAYGETSEAEAKRNALAKCGSTCKILGSYRNTCAAVAWGLIKKRGMVFTELNPQRGIVETKALSKCNASGASNCKIMMPAECSLPS